jgi:hypothetical protein
MKTFRLSQTVNAQRFRQVFDRRVPTDYSEVEHDEVYGAVDRSGYSLYIKRIYNRLLNSEYLRVEIDSNGTIQCQYKRTLSSILCTIVAPIILLVVGILLITVFHEPDPAGACFPMAIVFTLFGLFKSKSLRQQLLDTVSQVADEAKQS